uniref:Uncharacterized protein n=1 Tax=Panagrolaimus sp. ES5 TaxID=591445 RepID=A0AC34GTP0_9BILA
MKKWNFKIQIFGEFIFARRKADDPYLLSRLFKYFWNCKISTCFITEQILTVAEYEKLVKVVERLHMKNVRIVDAKNELIPVEILLEIGINLRDFCLELRKNHFYDKSFYGICSLETAQKLEKHIRPKKFRHLCLSQIPDNIDFDALIKFIKNNTDTNASIVIQFRNEIGGTNVVDRLTDVFRDSLFTYKWLIYFD